MAITLTAAVGPGEAQLRVSEAAPGAEQAQIGTELMRILSGADGLLWFVERGAFGSTRDAHEDGDTVYIAVPVLQTGEPIAPPTSGGGDGIPQGGPLTQDLDADGFAVKNLLDPVDDQDAVTSGWVQLNTVLQGGSLTADLNANAHKITGLRSPSAPGDAVNKGYVDDNTLTPAAVGAAAFAALAANVPLVNPVVTDADAAVNAVIANLIAAGLMAAS